MIYNGKRLSSPGGYLISKVTRLVRVKRKGIREYSTGLTCEKSFMRMTHMHEAFSVKLQVIVYKFDLIL